MINKEKYKKNDFQSYILENNKKISFLLENKNISYNIKEKDINIFSVLLKGISKKKLIYLKYISKISQNQKYNIKKSERVDFSKFFIKNQIILLFVCLYKYNCELNHYYNLIKILLFYLKNNQIIDDLDNLEIIYYNLIILFFELDSNRNINNNLSLYFNALLNTLIEIIVTNFKQFKLDTLLNIFDSIHYLLTEKNKILFLLRTKDNSNKKKNISLIQINEIKYIYNFIDNKNEFIKLKNKINDIMNLIYSFNLNKNYNDYLLLNIRNAFSELKNNYSKVKIINLLYKLNNQIESINDILLYENKIFKENKKDIFMPKRYFLFNKSKKSGINFNPKMSLITNNFTLIFSFKQNESEINKIYPLFSLYTKENIIFGIFLKNKNILVYFQDNYKEVEEMQIIPNKSYLIIIEYKKNDFVKIYINNEEAKLINYGKIKYKQITNVAIGYLPDDLIIKNQFKDFLSNYYGIIGPILFFNKIFEDQEFIINLFKLNGSYDILVNLNDNTFNYNDAYKQEINLINPNIINYFFSISKKLDESFLFNISPLSIINDYKIKDFNSYDSNGEINSNYFIENIYGKNDNKDKNYFADIFSTLDKPLSFNGATYPINQFSSAINFIQNDGFNLITLYFEYFYNILKMLIKLNDKNENNNSDTSTIYYHINKCICPLLNLLSNIINQCSNIMHYYKDSLDTMGFSFFKIFKILICQTSLNSELIYNLKEFLLYLNRIYLKSKEKESQNVIINFINKLLVIIFDRKVFNMKNFKEFNDFISIFKIVLKNNQYLVDSQNLDLIFNFAFVLDKNKFDKIENYKIISKEYKNLLKIFIIQINTIKLHCEYIHKVFNHEELNILIRYKLIKLYYLCNNVKLVYNQDNNSDQKEKINSFFNLFRRNKNNNVYNILLKEKLFKEYKTQFTYLVNINNYIDIEDKKYYELLKCLLIQLIYEQSVFIIPSKLQINYLDVNLLLSDIQISFFKFDEIQKKKEINKENKFFSRKEFYSFSIDDDIEVIENILDDNNTSQDFNVNNLKRKSEKHNTEKQQNFNKISIAFKKHNNLMLNEKEKKKTQIFGLFDELLIYEDTECIKDDIDISLYMFKSLFGCFFDNWNKDCKLKFIKNINDDSFKDFNLCINDFNRFKLKLFFQYIQLLEFINEPDEYEIITKLIYSFINRVIDKYKLNQNDKDFRRIFIHLFENKKIMSTLLNSFFNKKDNLINNIELKLLIESSIENINNMTLFFHPKPFIFSYIKNCIKNNKKYVIDIIKKISDFIIKDFKNNLDKDIDNNNATIFFFISIELNLLIQLKKIFKNMEIIQKIYYVKMIINYLI